MHLAKSTLQADLDTIYLMASFDTRYTFPAYSHRLSLPYSAIPALSSPFVAFRGGQWYHRVKTFERIEDFMKRTTTLVYRKYYNKDLDNPDILKDGDEGTTPKAILAEIEKCIKDVMAYHGEAKITVTIEESN